MRSRAHDLEIGLDVLGAGLGIGDFVPWLGAIGKVAGGLTGGGGGDADAVKKAAEAAVEKERQRQALEKAQAEAAKTRMLMYGILGVVGVGGVIATTLILKKK